ncbi:hypothetical protein ARMGADRAFT_1015592 [Armillaria gallica]|uniref:Uncharacterized protein n=1 Tax=Armillaria gallica TaxID=47427 RepID=A0A2H3DF14_ARMGA|nr:hypothetical protein ARMGADRAFT_1015592 [Armillaria gallica]
MMDAYGVDYPSTNTFFSLSSLETLLGVCFWELIRQADAQLHCKPTTERRQRR